MNEKDLICPDCGSRKDFEIGQYEIGCCICYADRFIACKNCDAIIASFTQCHCGE